MLPVFGQAFQEFRRTGLGLRYLSGVRLEMSIIVCCEGAALVYNPNCSDQLRRTGLRLVRLDMSCVIEQRNNSVLCGCCPSVQL